MRCGRQQDTGASQLVALGAPLAPPLLVAQLEPERPQLLDLLVERRGAARQTCGWGGDDGPREALAGVRHSRGSRRAERANGATPFRPKIFTTSSRTKSVEIASLRPLVSFSKEGLA